MKKLGIDEVIIFDRLEREDLKQIVGLQLDRVASRLEKQGFTLEFSDEAREFLAREGYDPVYGARPLKRAIQKWLLDPLSLDVLDGKIAEGAKVRVDVSGDGLAFSAS